MYGIAFLNEIVNKEKVFSPSDILNSLRDKIAGSLNRGDNEFETMDGMDMSVVTIDPVKHSLMFAGANNPLYHIRNGCLDIIRADKMPVAFFQKMDPFNIIEFEYMEGDVIYIFTDGIIDQFGGELGKKYLSKRLKDVLSDISGLPMTEQYMHLNNSFNEWKGEYFQVDDVLMVGFRL
jgi:serine phosphatase RsbU (regulator of sigma subunit)